MGLVYDRATNLFLAQEDIDYQAEDVARIGAYGAPLKNVWSNVTLGFGGCADAAEAGGNWASVAWPTANKAVACPIFVYESLPVAQLGWVNGSGTMTDHVDTGIYKTDWSKIVSTGSVARSGANSLQTADTADKVLAPGKYFLVQSTDGTTANQARVYSQQLRTLQLLGCYDSPDDLFPLPDPLTGMALAATFTFFPWIGLTDRTLW